MKKSFILMSLVLGALALTSCNNSDIESINKKGTFSFTVNTDTRAGIDGMNVVWQAGDKIALGAALPGETEVTAKPFEWVSGNTFSADTAYDATKTYDFYAVYPSVGGKSYTPSREQNPNAYSKYINFGKKSLTQVGQSMDSVMAYAPMYGTASAQSPENLCITLHHAAALLDFEILNAMNSPVTIKSFKMETPAGCPFCGTYYLSYDGSLKPSGENYVYNYSEVTVKDAAAIGNSFHIYMPVAPFSLPAGSEVKFTITSTDNKVCTVIKTLSNGVEFTAGTVNRQQLTFDASSDVTYSTLAEVITGGAGTYNVKDAVVLGVSGGSIILGDGTANILAYKKDSGLAAGEIVTINGTTKSYNGVDEFDDPVFTKTGTVSQFSRGTAMEFGDAQVQAYAGNPTIDYVSASGALDSRTLTISDAGYLWCSNENDSQGKYADFNDKIVDVKGYTYGFQNKSGKTSVSFMITEIAEKVVATPSISLPASSSSFEASDSGSGVKKSIDFTAENTDVTITCSTADWLSFSANNSTKHFEFYPTSANTGSARTATVTIAASAGSQYNKTFTITQKGVSVGDEIVKYDFTVDTNYPDGFPDKTGTKTTSPAQFTVGGKTFTLYAPTAYYKMTDGKDKTLFFGKTTSDFATTAYIEIPAKEGYTIRKIVVANSSGCAANVSVNIYTTSGTTVSTAVNTVKGGTMEFEVAGALNTPYRISSLVSGKNLQFDTVEVTYSK